MPRARPIREVAMPSHLEPHDHDYDGRPSVGYWEDDVLLERLCRYHPERIPADLKARFCSDYVRTRAPRVAAALSLHPA